MSSPVEKILTSIIKIEKSSNKPIYIQISEAISKAVSNQILPVGSKMPGTRTLCVLLNIHRKTAVAAYEELEKLGIVHILPNKGTFISNNYTTTQLNDSENSSKSSFLSCNFTFKQSLILDNPFEFSNCEFSFNDGTPDVRLFRPASISAYYSSNLKRKQNQKKFYNTEGSEFFKYHFSKYLNSTRGLNISSENLLITRSTEMTVYLLSKLLLQPADTVVVGDLSYFAVNMIFQKSGASVKTVPVDKHGIDVDALENLCLKTKIRLVYINSQNHYPTAVMLNAERRKKLSELSQKFDFIIIEDDNDYDFQYEKSSLPMASTHNFGKIIYIGSFGKTLAPGFRTGFAVSSPDFISELKKYLGIIDKQGDILMEQALGEMIDEGEIDRHLRKSLKVYRERRDGFAAQLKNYFGDKITFEKPSGGMAFWLEFKDFVNLSKVSENCKKKGLFIPRTLLYQHKNLCAMRLGFAHFNETESAQALEIFASEAAT